MAKLTKRAVDALAPRERPYISWDSEVKGLGCRVMPTGSKTFVLEYRPGAGGRAVNKRKLKLGAYGAVTPDEARKAALDALARVRLGDDPQEEKAKERAAANVETLVETFLADHVGTKLKPKARVDYAIVFGKLVRAHGKVKARDLTTGQVAALHRDLAGTPYQANKLLDAVSSLFVWAERHGHLPEGHPNPARKVTRYREQGRERFLSSEELARLGESLRVAETTGLPYEINTSKPTAKHASTDRRTIIDPFAVATIRLLILCGARLREVLHAKWEHVDFERGLLNLADSKTGKRAVFLNAAALEVLASLPHIDGNPHVFPGGKEGQPRFDIRKPWAAVTRAAGLEGLRVHDLRHSHASVGASAGLSLPIIGKLLGHAQASTTQRYAHLANDPIREASERIGAIVSAALDGDPGGDVTPLRTRK